MALKSHHFEKMYHATFQAIQLYQILQTSTSNKILISVRFEMLRVKATVFFWCSIPPIWSPVVVMNGGRIFLNQVTLKFDCFPSSHFIIQKNAWKHLPPKNEIKKTAWRRLFSIIQSMTNYQIDFGNFLSIACLVFLPRG